MDGFEFTFTEKQLLERRLARLDEREGLIEARLDRMFARKQTAKRVAKIERFVDQLEAVRKQQAIVQDQLINFKEVTGTPDSYDFDFDYSKVRAGNGRTWDWGRGTFKVTDSLTDNTFEAGDVLTVQAIGERPRGGRRITFRTLEGVESGDVTTFTFGSSNLGELAANYDTLTFKAIDEEGNTIFSSAAIDVTNIV